MFHFWKRGCLGAACAVVLLAGSLHAQGLPADVDAFLAAGEFAPAIAAVQRVEDPAERDRLLGQVAAAQGEIGARRAAIFTASDIESDLVRSDVLRGIGDQPVRPRTGFGGGPQADFDSLIDLITSTVQPDTWADAGGTGAIAPFEGGVHVDAQGVLHRQIKEDTGDWLARLRQDAVRQSSNSRARQASPLRKISLTRLERLVQLKLAAGEPLDEELRTLAGLQRIRYVMVYPETRELVVAGPAGDWTTNAEGRIISVANMHPVVRLDDLVVVLRHMLGNTNGQFGCSIDPRRENLARTQEFLAASAKSPIRPSRRDAWLEDVRGRMGLQDVSVYGIDPRTRVGRVLVEADYLMKLVGLGKAETTLGLAPYLDRIQVKQGEAPPPVDVLRWWFTLNYTSIETTPEHNIFLLRGQGVKVMSENELLAAQGRRVQTGQSEPLNRQFAEDFTRHFPTLARRHLVFADLQNIFDLALVGAIIRSEDLAGQADWHLTCFNDPTAYEVPLAPAPQAVESVMAHRVINGVHIVAAVSGGVRVDPASLATRDNYTVDRTGALRSEAAAGQPTSPDRDRWWWD